MNELTAHPDYRLSHASRRKAVSYDGSFERVRFRAFMSRQEQRVLDGVLDKYLGDRPVTHLDFACGAGRVISWLAGRAQSSTGIDVSEEMIRLARAKAPQAELIVGDITRADPLGRRRFDLITAFRFFPNAQLELRLRAMRALARHLSLDGVLVFNNHRCDSGSLFRLARLMGKRPSTMRLAECTDLAEAAGLDVAELLPIGTLPVTDGRMLLPRWAHSFCDRLAGALGLSARLAQNVIFVCRPQRRAKETVRAQG